MTVFTELVCINMLTLAGLQHELGELGQERGLQDRGQCIKMLETSDPGRIGKHAQPLEAGLSQEGERKWLKALRAARCPARSPRSHSLPRGVLYR